MINDKKRKSYVYYDQSGVQIGKVCQKEHAPHLVCFVVCLSVCFVLFPTATTTTHT